MKKKKKKKKGAEVLLYVQRDDGETKEGTAESSPG